MKKEFIEKWKTDKKYQAKIKLLLYGLFIIFVTIYALMLNNSVVYNNITNDTNLNETTTDDNYIISIKDNYKYLIRVNIDDKKIEYTKTKNNDNIMITKTIDNITTNYIYKNNEYFIEDNDIYLKTTKDEVYDIVNYNYINIDSINNYLKTATKNNNQYIIYLKDIILNNQSNDYFVILINNNEINIDYTPLVKEYNSSIEKYKVYIKIEEYKEVN